MRLPLDGGGFTRSLPNACLTVNEVRQRIALQQCEAFDKGSDMEKIVTDTALNNLTTLVGTHARGTPQTVRFGSVCSGIEAASVAWGPLGWKAAWFSEIDKFPCAVLNHHYPDVKNFGDMRSLPSRILSGEIEAPDVLCGGTPCQAFSFAGSRQSLKDERGSLSLTFCEIANAVDSVRSGLQQPPAIVLWENVPGALNTDDNAFGCFVAGVAGEDEPLEPPGGRWANAGYVLGPKRAVAWRVLDAQYFGLAQRRRRVFVVASARNDFDPAEVLFEFDGMRRDTAPRREAGQDVAKCLTTGTGSRYDWETEDIIPVGAFFAGQGAKAGSIAYSTDVAPTLKASDSGTNHTPSAHVGMLVRRLTPEECEALQGFPRRYTAIPWRKKPADQCPDGPRYKALGNSWAVPVVRWVGQRIDQLLSGSPQLRVGDLKHPS